MKYIKLFESNIDLSNKRLDKSTFEHRGNTYRLSEWYYIYKLKDGGMKYAVVDKENANAAGGTGVAGTIVPLSEIKWLDRETPFSEDQIKLKEESHKIRVKKDKELYEFLLDLQPDLTEDEYDEIQINHAVNSMFRPDGTMKRLR